MKTSSSNNAPKELEWNNVGKGTKLLQLQKRIQEKGEPQRNASKTTFVAAINIGEMDYKVKYELFGLVPSPFPPGSKNVKAEVEKSHQSTIVRKTSETQALYSKEYIDEVRSAYKTMGIQFPSSQDGSGGSLSLKQQSHSGRAYKMFGIPLSEFFGGPSTTK